MSLPENTQFIPKSDIINRVIEADSNIESFDFDFISELNENAYNDGYYIEYKQRIINGVYKYIPIKTIYDKTNTPGLDQIGNIQLNSKLQIPLLHGDFYYYPNKEYELKIIQKKNNHPNIKKVICYTTNEIFDSTKDASK